jgi:hypothetical protein
MIDQPEHDPIVERFQRAYDATATPLGRAPIPRRARPLRVLVPLLIAAVLVLAIRTELPDRPVAAPRGADSLVTVNFVLLQDAHDVAVVGDFNGWDPKATPMTRSGPGRPWQASARLGQGRVEYAFVVDGRTWIPDPNAPVAPASEFGGRNSVLTIRSHGAL